MMCLLIHLRILTMSTYDVFIHDDAVIKQSIFIGNHSAIDKGVYITSQCEIGSYVHLSPYVTVIGGKETNLKIGDFVFVSTHCTLVCGSEDYCGAGLVGATIPEEFREFIDRDIVLEDYSGLGAGCIVLPGVTIGEGAVVGAGSLVTKDVSPWTVNYGSPSRAIKHRPKEKVLEYGSILKGK